jgi:hypothetical protein
MSEDVIKWNELSPWERNVEVAEKVMGLCGHRRLEPYPPHPKDFQCVECKCRFCFETIEDETPRSRPYTLSISAAWEVIEHIAPRIFSLNRYNDGPHCEMSDGNDNSEVFSAYGTSFPEAICITALKAKGYEIDRRESCE